MGVVLKTSDATVGIDMAGTYESESIADIGGLLDVLIVTHPHSDHLDPSVAAAAAKVGAKIVVADESVRLDDSTPPQVVRDPMGLPCPSSSPALPSPPKPSSASSRA